MSPHGHNADGRLSLRKEEAQSSLRPTSSRVMTWTLAKEDSFQDGGSRGLQRLSRQRWLSSPPGTMWQGGGRKEFSGAVLLSANQRKPAATTIARLPESAAYRRAGCVPPPQPGEGSAPLGVQFGKTPAREEWAAPKSPGRGVSWGNRRSASTLRHYLSIWDAG